MIRMTFLEELLSGCHKNTQCAAGMRTRSAIRRRGGPTRAQFGRPLGSGASLARESGALKRLDIVKLAVVDVNGAVRRLFENVVKG
jgi:hypothetical protein